MRPSAAEQPAKVRRRVPWPDTRFIYAIQEQRRNGLVKIGTANDLGKRMRELQARSEHPLSLIWVELWVGVDARRAEAMIHWQLRDHRAKPHVMSARRMEPGREWFHPRAEVMDFIGGWATSVEEALARAPRHLEGQWVVPPEERPPGWEDEELRRRELLVRVGALRADDTADDR
jgi:hypothetical protein